VKRKHHELLAWQEGIVLVKEAYRLSASFPREEIYGLTSQLRRAAVSVPSNIAEGAARNGDREFIQFLSIARGSLSELETQAVIARELGYFKKGDEEVLLVVIDRIFGLIGGLINAIKERNVK
jgi:four helix bundle protein